jgi:hypothetical protein
VFVVMERRDSAFRFPVECVPTRRIKQETLILSLCLFCLLITSDGSGALRGHGCGSTTVSPC